MTGEWYLIRIRTAHLLGGVNLGQPFDFTNACTTSAPPESAADFGQTWEYFGMWRPTAGASWRAVGGGRWTIVSARAREALDRLELRHLAFEPITLLGVSDAQHY